MYSCNIILIQLHCIVNIFSCQLSYKKCVNLCAGVLLICETAESYLDKISTAELCQTAEEVSADH